MKACLKHRLVTAEVQDKPPVSADQSAHLVDQFLDHRTNVAALGRVADRRERVERSHLTDDPQDVAVKGAERHD